jgi:hypothetical protein
MLQYAAHRCGSVPVACSSSLRAVQGVSYRLPLVRPIASDASADPLATTSHRHSRWQLPNAIEGVLCSPPGQAEVCRLDAMNRSHDKRHFPLAALLVGFLAGVGAVAGGGASLDHRPKVFQILALAIAGVAAGGAAAMAVILSRGSTKGSSRTTSGPMRPAITGARPTVPSRPAARPTPTFGPPSIRPRANSRRRGSKKNPQFCLSGLC